MAQQARVFEANDNTFAADLTTYLGTLTIASTTQPNISIIVGGSRIRVLITYRDA
jgi:hypothetical protein